MTNTKGFLNRNQLKYLVIAAMLIDHIAWAFVPTASLLGQVMHVIGRLTGPTMAYMLAEGYHYTRNVKKYAMRLGIFAVISWLPFSYFESGGIRPAFAAQSGGKGAEIALSGILKPRGWSARPPRRNFSPAIAI